jgi:hypothetical protein
MAIRDCSKVLEILEFETMPEEVDTEKLKFKAHTRRAEAFFYLEDMIRA